MAYTKVSKPGPSTYTKLSQLGNEFFDAIEVTFDSTVTLFDGTNSLLWTKIASPSYPLSLSPGMATGLMIPLTTSQSSRPADNWTRIKKPT